MNLSYYPLASRCMFCGSIIGDEVWEPAGHQGVEFVNGYPTNCRMGGVNPFINNGDVDRVWIIQGLRRVYSHGENVIIEDNR